MNEFIVHDAYGPFDDAPGRSEFLEKFGIDLHFSGNVNYSIRGTNGSGKSGLTSTLLQFEPELKYIKTGKYVRATIFPTYNLIGLGEYRIGKNCGGCDTIRSPKNDNPVTLQYIKENYPGYAIENSGMMVSTIRSPITQLEEIFPDKTVVCCYMNTPYDVCLDRIRARSGYGPDKEFKNVEFKYKMMETQRRKYADAGINIEMIDTSSWESMLHSYVNIEMKYGK